jgi:hypothetical protein
VRWLLTNRLKNWLLSVSSRPFNNPARPSEISHDVSYWYNLAIGVGLAILIVAIGLYRLVFWEGNSAAKERRKNGL